MVFHKSAPARAIKVAALAIAFVPASASAGVRNNSSPQAINRPTASNPYHLAIKRNAQPTTTVIARWTEPPTFAIAPRTIGLTFGSNYFDRSAYAGPPQRGRAYNVRRKDS